MKSILIIDDHDIVRHGLHALISSSKNYQVVDIQADLAGGIAAIERHQPDLVLCDMSLGDSKGLDTVRAVVHAQAPRPVLMVSMHDEMLYAEQTLALGARGYLMKERAQEYVTQAIDAILRGNVWVSSQVNAYLLNRLMRRSNRLAASSPASHVNSLSQRELQILEKIGAGKTSKEIAFDFGLSHRTVDTHRANIKKKLDLKTSSEIVAFAVSRT